MNYPEPTAGLMFFYMVLALVAMAAFPFIKALLLHGATRILKFTINSYWKSLFCILIGIGATMAIQMVLLGTSMQFGQEYDPYAISGAAALGLLSGLFLAPIAETISLLLFFKEPAGKTIGAVALSYLFAAGLAILLFLVFVVALFILGLVVG